MRDEFSISHSVVDWDEDLLLQSELGLVRPADGGLMHGKWRFNENGVAVYLALYLDDFFRVRQGSQEILAPSNH